MSEYTLVLRLFHIGFGVFWAGGAMMLAWYLLPAVRKSGADGPKFMTAFSSTNRFPVVMTISAVLAITAGWLLIVENMKSGSAWMGSPMGITLSIGGTLGTIAFLIGFFVSRPTVMKIQKIGTMIAETGNPPTDEQKALLAKLQKRVYIGAQMVAGLLAITILLMAMARHSHVFSSQ